MSNKLRIVAAQLNLPVGDIAGNLKKHIETATIARDELEADVIVFPELSLTGYPPEDLLLRRKFIDKTNEALNELIAIVKNIYVVVGYPEQLPRGIYNACAIFYNHSILGKYTKQHLPNYEVFDEDRYFIAGGNPCVVTIKDIPIGLVICEDLWFHRPTRQSVSQGARLIISPNASPFEIKKHARRVHVVSKRAIENKVPIIYVNAVGGQDELIFDGGSMAFAADGEVCQFAGFFNEKLLPIDVDFSSAQAIVQTKPFSLPDETAKIYEALVMSMRDYIKKNHFPGVLLGVSGGIDSALTLAIAVDALGKDKVQAILMPSRYTSNISIEDATQLAQKLGVSTRTIPIEPAYESFLNLLTPVFNNKKPDITEENIQARCRAVILMALSNASGNLVLTTGNRSELAVGYCTLYGDMAGGFAVLKDVPKTLVYQLAEYRNQASSVIPERILTRPPSAELAPNQKDEDYLPPYAVLDQILEKYLNENKSADEIIEQGFDAKLVNLIIHMLYKNEYKRRQSAVGPRINPRSFGKDWRYPITNAFHE